MEQPVFKKRKREDTDTPQPPSELYPDIKELKKFLDKYDQGGLYQQEKPSMTLRDLQEYLNDFSNKELYPPFIGGKRKRKTVRRHRSIKNKNKRKTKKGGR